jgi:phosphomannomutase
VSAESFDALRARARAWCEDDPDAETAAAVRALLGDDAGTELAALFAGTLTFGTAGLRGPVGPGPLAMNRRVIMRATAGLCAHLDEARPDARTQGIVIGYDARPSSRPFAEDAASVAAGQGFVVHLFPTHVPTPIVAYALRAFGCAAGLVVTASHNPKGDNGLKVYSANGAQIIPPEDTAIARHIDAIEHVLALPRADIARDPLIRIMHDDLIERYLDAVLELVPRKTRTLGIAYTPLHGVGGTFAQSLLALAGFDRVAMVTSQAEPDGTFPTAPFPNPEEPAAMAQVLSLMADADADLALANDPDADRLAAAIRTPSGVRVLDGNEIGALLTDHRLRTANVARPLVVATIVTSPFIGAIARARGARYEETLTGHKWIHACAARLEPEGYALVLGCEEALGYACSSLVRDKDGLSALLVLAHAADEAKRNGKTLADTLDALAREVGLFVSRSFSLKHEGVDGPSQMADTLRRLRNAPPESLGDEQVIAITDILAGTRQEGDSVQTITLPKSDVLVFELAPTGRVMVRPSGTEPKLKVYFDVREPIAEGEDIAAARARANVRLDGLVAAMRARLA